MRLLLALLLLFLALPAHAADQPPATQPASKKPTLTPKPKRKNNLPAWVKGIDSLNLPPEKKAQADKILDEYDQQYEAFLQAHGKEQDALYNQVFAARKANDHAAEERIGKRLREVGKLQTAVIFDALKKFALFLTEDEYARFRAHAQWLLPWPMALEVLNLPAPQQAQVTQIFQDLEDQTSARKEKDDIEYKFLTNQYLHAKSVNDYPTMNEANRLAAWLESEQIDLRMNARTRLTHALTPAQLARFDILTTSPRFIFPKNRDSYSFSNQRAQFNAEQTATCHEALLRLAASIDRFQTPIDSEPAPIRQAFLDAAINAVMEDIYQCLLPFTDTERMDLICAKGPGRFHCTWYKLDLEPSQLQYMRDSIAAMETRFNAAPTQTEKSLVIEAALRHTFAILSYSQRPFIISHMFSNPRLNPTRFADNR